MGAIVHEKVLLLLKAIPILHRFAVKLKDRVYCSIYTMNKCLYKQAPSTTTAIYDTRFWRK